jgi:hypothetical protein
VANRRCGHRQQRAARVAAERATAIIEDALRDMALPGQVRDIGLA